MWIDSYSKNISWNQMLTWNSTELVEFTEFLQENRESIFLKFPHCGSPPPSLTNSHSLQMSAVTLQLGLYGSDILLSSIVWSIIAYFCYITMYPK